MLYINVLPQLCGKIATDFDVAFRTPKNTYENLMRKTFFSQMPMIEEILSIVYMFLMWTTENISNEKKKKSC